jgi:hypothetical protein
MVTLVTRGCFAGQKFARLIEDHGNPYMPINRACWYCFVSAYDSSAMRPAAEC